jgi:leucyl-tRNA synthetase
MEYNFSNIEKKWQQWWTENKVYQVSNESLKPKYYVLDMFPYPSGAGLHVGHPLGYIASDIYARFKRLKGHNVLHPMGYDAFGLPAEQYAIEHGVHPAVSTKQNIENFRRQLDKIGFSFDWKREVNTSDPKYYKWTQWIFLQLFKSFYNRNTNKAEHIDVLISAFEKEGNKNHPFPVAGYQLPVAGENRSENGNEFTADEWNAFDEFTRQSILMEYRLAYCGYGEVNWCEALGTVLANDEVVKGVSERGGYPVVKKKLRQWYLRITEYADRLLEGLKHVDFSESMKEMQSNWIGKSYGAEIDFAIVDHEKKLKVYTTRPDTIFGVDFMVLAPEHELVEKITKPERKQEVEEYLAYVKSRTERDRMAEKNVTGCFTGAYALNPLLSSREVPIYISEYVLAGYGTGAIMAVPCGDERDFRFAKHFNIPITNIIGDKFNGEEANPTWDAELQESDFLTGMLMRDAAEVVITDLEAWGRGKRKVNYKMHDAAFSRQRYWGEPIPIKWNNGIAYPLDENELPLELPYVESYKPGPEGEGPLANIEEWKDKKVKLDLSGISKVSPEGGDLEGALETNTMPGYAGSSWYFLRYMDPHNDKEFCSRKASDYWAQVDLYIGGTEHAVGHLLYSRMWTKALYDLGYISHDEPYKRLVNQGMIQGSSRLVFLSYRIEPLNISTTSLSPVFISYGLYDKWKKKEITNYQILEKINEKIPNYYNPENSHKAQMLVSQLHLDDDIFQLHVDVNIVDGVELNIEAFKKWRPEYKDAIFITEDDGKYICGIETEKMSKSKFNTVNPDNLVEKYGADTFRMYEMFLGPVEQSKPWDTKGIEGVYRFLRKLWRLFFDEQKGKIWNEEKATDAELKVLHKAIKKIEEDTERFSFNTAVSAFMVCVNELTDLKCSKKEILEPLLIMLSSYAPHISEELWHELGNTTTVLNAAYPVYKQQYTIESAKEYPVSINGKLRTTIVIDLNASQDDVEKIVLRNDVVKKWTDDKTVKKFIFVKGKMVNVVI